MEIEMEMEMDHGILNVPLAKRGNIDAQIDVYKAQQAAQAKADQKSRSAKHRELKAQAKTMLAEIIAAPGLLDSKAEKFNQPKKLLLSTLDGYAKWEPAKLISLHGLWITT